MKIILLIVSFCFFSQLFGQEIVGIKDLYVENDLTYKISDDKLFSGQAQHIRKNGHLVYEDFFVNGKMTKSVTYYNGTEKPKQATVTEFYNETETKRKITNYGLTEPKTEYRHYDKNEKKILIEQYENEKLTYRCEYQGNKKHGTEYCLNDDGTELRTEYQNGKKIKKNKSR